MYPENSIVVDKSTFKMPELYSLFSTTPNK